MVSFFLLNLFHLRSSLNLNSFNFRPLIQLVLLFNHPVKVPIINVPAFSKYSLKFLLKISIVWCVFKFEFKWFVQEVTKDRVNVCAPLGHVYALFYVFNFVEVLLVSFLVLLHFFKAQRVCGVYLFKNWFRNVPRQIAFLQKVNQNISDWDTVVSSWLLNTTLSVLWQKLDCTNYAPAFLCFIVLTCLWSDVS